MAATHERIVPQDADTFALNSLVLNPPCVFPTQACAPITRGPAALCPRTCAARGSSMLASCSKDSKK